MQSDMQEYLKFYTLHPQIKCKTHLIWNENPVFSWEPGEGGEDDEVKKIIEIFSMLKCCCLWV